jgi:hypothetical protein
VEETPAMDERLRFVQAVHRPGWSIAELCRPVLMAGFELARA